MAGWGNRRRALGQGKSSRKQRRRRFSRTKPKQVTPKTTLKSGQRRVWRRRVGVPNNRIWRQRKLTARQATGIAATPLVSDDGYELNPDDYDFED